MARINARHIGRRLPGPVLAALAVITALTTAPTVAAASTGPSPATPSALTQAFEAGRHFSGSAIGGIRPGSLHTGTVGGTEWAIASFTPSTSASKQEAAGFQDGGGTGVFSIQNDRWRLVGTGLYGCGEGLPGTLKHAWGLAAPAGCTATIATQRAAAKHALSAFPPPARAAAAVGSFVMALVASLTGLVTQPTLAFGVELLAFGCVLWLLQFHAIRTGWQSDRAQRRPGYEAVFELVRGQAQVLPFLVAGALYAVEVDAANYVLLAGILAVFVLSMLDAWILLVEILR